MAYPRQLAFAEREFLNWLLPQEISAYATYSAFMNSSLVIGEGRWGEGNLILDKKVSTIDLTLGMPPVIAFGECTIEDTTLTISVHEINIDGQLEVQFSGLFPIPTTPIVETGWCYSYWKPGSPCPATSSVVKEVALRNDVGELRYVLAVSEKQKVIWLHHILTGFNQLIPVTGFYDELLRSKGIRDAGLIAHPATFFDRVGFFTDVEYIKALFEYDKKASRKFDMTGITAETQTEKKSIFQKLMRK